MEDCWHGDESENHGACRAATARQANNSRIRYECLERLASRRCSQTHTCVGNEAVGMRSSVFSICDALVRIPALTDKVDSLNVSTATAILLYQLTGLSEPTN